LCKRRERSSFKKNVVHRDIAARNFLVHADGRIVIADFGVALDLEGSPISVALGVPINRRPPEALNFNYQLNLSYDIYGVGVLLFEIFTPISQIRDTPNLPSSYNANELWKSLPPNVAQIIKDCWLEEEKRPTIKEILDRLEAMQSEYKNSPNLDSFLSDYDVPECLEPENPSSGVSEPSANLQPFYGLMDHPFRATGGEFKDLTFEAKHENLDAKNFNKFVGLMPGVELNGGKYGNLTFKAHSTFK